MKSLPRSTAKDVFLHLLSVGTLYVAVISFIALFFEYINVKFPDALNFYYLGSLDTIRQSMASLFIVWPVFVLVTWLTYGDLREAPEKQGGGIRKWLLYLTLFFTSITIIVDLITLVNYFLNGEITTRFLLKVLTVLVTASGVFAYYLWDLRRDTKVKTSLPRITAWGTSVGIAVSIALGFFFVGSPAHQRLIRLDDERTTDLSVLQNNITNFYVDSGKLPTDLEALKNGATQFNVPVDPITKTSYTYTVTSDVSYTLCATFAADSVSAPEETAYYYGEDWKHTAGTVCFERKVDPSMIDGKAQINLIAPLKTPTLAP